jgi:phospholipase C
MRSSPVTPGLPFLSAAVSAVILGAVMLFSAFPGIGRPDIRAQAPHGSISSGATVPVGPPTRSSTPTSSSTSVAPTATATRHPPPTPGAAPTVPVGQSASTITHIVIIVKENRSFDQYFGTFPGADGATKGEVSNGTIVPLGHTPDHLFLDINHAGNAARKAVNGGLMNQFNRLSGAIQNGQDVAMSEMHQSDLPNYWRLAGTYTLDDHFFSTIDGPSFPNHLGR